MWGHWTLLLSAWKRFTRWILNLSTCHPDRHLATKPLRMKRTVTPAEGYHSTVNRQRTRYATSDDRVSVPALVPCTGPCRQPAMPPAQYERSRTSAIY